MLVASNDGRTRLSEDLVVESMVEKSNHVGGKTSECDARSEVRGDGGLLSRKGRENEAAQRDVGSGDGVYGGDRGDGDGQDGDGQ